MNARANYTQAIRELPAQLETKIKGLTIPQLTTPYVSGEWTIAQNIHHLADTHMICFRRFKLILTSPDFHLTRYNVNAIAQYPDAKDADIAYSLSILRGLHARWTIMLENLSDDEWQKSGHFWNPEKPFYSLEELAESYAGHGQDHLTQIQDVLDAMSN